MANIVVGSGTVHEPIGKHAVRGLRFNTIPNSAPPVDRSLALGKRHGARIFRQRWISSQALAESDRCQDAGESPDPWLGAGPSSDLVRSRLPSFRFVSVRWCLKIDSARTGHAPHHSVPQPARSVAQ
eukprot:jgi/Psemu1/304260/fgenesh1_kg.142_\